MALVLPFPVIDPVAVSIGPIAVRWYALAYIAGIILGWFYARRLVANDRLWPPRQVSAAGNAEDNVPASGIRRDDLDDFVVWATLAVVIGGRLGFVLFYNLDYYLQHPLEALMVWRGGMSFHGGMIGVIVTVAIFSHLKGLPPFRFGDAVVAVVPIGIFFGRIANFINAELWGRVTDVPWAMVFPGAGPEPRHPSQLYEAFLEGILLFIILRIATHRFQAFHMPGMVFGLFLVGYGAGRTAAEFFRQYDPQIGLFFGWMTMGMALSIPMIIAGIAVMAIALRRASTAKSHDAASANE